MKFEANEFKWKIFDCDTKIFSDKSDYLNQVIIKLESFWIQDDCFIKIKIDFAWYDWMYKQYMSSNYSLNVSEINGENFLHERSFKYVTALSEVQKFLDLLETYPFAIKIKKE